MGASGPATIPPSNDPLIAFFQLKSPVFCPEKFVDPQCGQRVCFFNRLLHVWQ
jgi:hypothetical protein